MHKLTLDPSTLFGWCLLVDDSRKPEDERRQVGQRLFYGTWDLTRDKDGKKCSRRGEYAWNLWNCFNALMSEHGIEGEEVEIILEGESYGSLKSEAGRRLAALWLTVLEMMCERKGLLYPRTCPPGAWRKAFIGHGQAPKEVGAGLKDEKRYAARRKWLKDAVSAECLKRGLRPKNDNEADALGLMFFSVRGGGAALDAKKREKRAASNCKRAQGKFELEAA
ncbi:hypothetical protein [Mesorhizobium amorphae]|uniref:hypothetical protein n=1 Tax=Mesorhizobium amorphae TaxID=71433 RepID=UPI0011852456|nr:hypothetical protein [Mesorhizobium amorphae]